MTKRELFLETINGRVQKRKPVWLMRQAGRFLPSYRQLRDKYDFLTMCTTPELASEATLLPLYELDVDVLVLFSDILIPLKALGAEIYYKEGESPSVSGIDIKSLSYSRDLEPVMFVSESIAFVKEAEPDVPLVGFAAAPFTLACYLFGSGDEFASLRSFIYSNDALFVSIMEEITLLTVDYLRMQVKAGCDAVQLFDTWAGLLPESVYERLVMPFVRRIISEIKSAPVIYYVRSAHHLLDQVVELGADCLSVDWRENLIEVYSRTCRPVQGNLDNALLMSDKEAVKKATLGLLRKTGKIPHIVNLGHGVLPNSSPDLAKVLIETVRTFEA